MAATETLAPPPLGPAQRIQLPLSPVLGATRLRAHKAHLGMINAAEDLVHYAVAIVLMVVAIVVLWDTAAQLASASAPFAAAATTAVNGVLFAIIVMEIMRTVVAHFEKGGLQLQPFLIIGIISAVREVLTVGARLSLDGSRSGQVSGNVVHTALLELGINAAVVLVLAGSLVLIRRLGRMETVDPQRETRTSHA